MYYCFIIDDDQYAIDALCNYIENIPELSVTGKFTNPSHAVAFIKNNPKPDVVFLDINMPELSGFCVAESLPNSTAIIFTTSYVEHALPAFEYKIVDFLLKPISFENFKKSVGKILSLLQIESKAAFKRSKEYFFINTGIKGTVLQLKFSDIEFVKALDNYVIIHTNVGHHITYLTMTEIEQALPETQFLRVHRSYIVNMDLIKIVQGNEIHLSNAIKLPLGSSFRDNFIKKIQSATLKSKRQ